MEDYLQAQLQLWFSDLDESELPALTVEDQRRYAEASVALGQLLRRHIAFHELVHATATLVDMNVLAERWQQQLNLPDLQHARALLGSLLSLVATARNWLEPKQENPSRWCQPFLQVGAQLWLRELRRMVCSVPVNKQPPSLQFADDLKDPLKPLHLPLLQCRDCHMAAWGAVAKDADSHLNGDLQDFYQAWFQYSPHVRLLSPLTQAEAQDRPLHGLCRRCLRLQTHAERPCRECQSEDVLPVWVPEMLRPPANNAVAIKSHHDCPECGARDGLFVLGYRAATLTSVMVGRLFATPYNDDHKLIAFSDSVQDAAHRAGFMGARTWRQVVRQAMLAWLEQLDEPVSLQAMTDQLPAFWRKQIDHDGRFCGVFIPPNLTWKYDYEQLRLTGALPAGSTLANDVSMRLHWECLAEFGQRSVVGRSLERTNSAAIALDYARLCSDAARVASQLREEVELLRDVGDADFLQFVLGWLHHLRQVGAIYDPILDGYIANKGKEILLNRIGWMPGFGRSQRPPAAISLGHLVPNFEALLLGHRDTWSVNWLKRTLAREQVFVAAEARQIFQRLLSGLTHSGWLVERMAAGEPVYMLNPEQLLVSKHCNNAVCDSCRHPLQFAPAMAEAYAALPCLRRHCMGRMVVNKSADPVHAYSMLEPRRLVPHEHTGLLSREVLGAVEHSFITGHEPWDVNLLSATPTLEMGIDIGDLSSVFLCSVPPAQANYLQRIGRAGRRDGNALAVTVANGRNHDLYFYSEPKEMIAGAVHTPGVFLQARAVLERQLLAYCFDLLVKAFHSGPRCWSGSCWPTVLTVG